MDREEMAHCLSRLGVWTKGDQRAPHKPLLLLLTLARAQQGADRLVSYKEIERPLADLLREFGPARRSYHSEFPFWHLQSDGIWELTDRSDALSPTGKISIRALRNRNVRGGLDRAMWELFRRDPEAVAQAARLLLETNFPETLHDDILAAVGLDTALATSTVKSGRRIRSAVFRERVLRAYDYRCAVCGLDIRLGHMPVALEAAHIKWFQAGGPDEINNGLALCTLHHKLLDRGAIGIGAQGQILVSDNVNGHEGFEEWVGRFHNAELRTPRNLEYAPADAFAKWHIREVFQGNSSFS